MLHGSGLARAWYSVPGVVAPREVGVCVRHPVIASRAVQIGHRREVMNQVSGQAAREQRVPPRLDRNVLMGDRDIAHIHEQSSF